MAVPPPSPSGDKERLRAELRLRRRSFVAALPEERRRALLDALAERVLAEVPGHAIVAGYAAAGAEIDPATLLTRLSARGTVLALPHVKDRDTPMRFLRWSPGEPLADGPFGLRQPLADSPEIEPSLILTPLVGFDRARRRLGQGAAFYDRAFAAHPTATRVGLAWSVQEADMIPMDPWDLPLDAIATEAEWIG